MNSRVTLRWGCAGLCLGVLIAFAASLRWTFGYTTYTSRSWYCVVVSSGALRGDRISTAFWSRSLPPRGPLLEPTVGPVRWIPSITGTQWQIPLWMPLGVLGVPTAVLWRRSRRATAVCGTCGYPRVGLPARSRCPECGT